MTPVASDHARRARAFVRQLRARVLGARARFDSIRLPSSRTQASLARHVMQRLALHSAPKTSARVRRDRLLEAIAREILARAQRLQPGSLNDFSDALRECCACAHQMCDAPDPTQPLRDPHRAGRSLPRAGTRREGHAVVSRLAARTHRRRSRRPRGSHRSSEPRARRFRQHGTSSCRRTRAGSVRSAAPSARRGRSR